MARATSSCRLGAFLLSVVLSTSCDTSSTLPLDPPAGNVPAPVSSVIDQVSNRYIVVFKPEVTRTDVQGLARGLVSAHEGQMHYIYQTALHGFAATLPPPALQAIRNNPRVAYVVPDNLVYPSTVQQPDATWGLDRIDQRDLPLNTFYNYDRTGAGVRVYVIDSGILTSHNEFGGRAVVGTDFVGDGQNGQDCFGHGTHVSGTIGGATYGVAKGVQLVAVRVFNCAGDGIPSSTTIAAVDWVTANGQLPAAVNMSLGGSFSQATNDAVANSIAAGFVYAVAAGNESADACNASPASTPTALTVGASTSSDVMSSFSNWGSCVDLFAPGSSITSAYWTSNSATATMSGTSMATPHVAGVAALVLEGSPNATPAAVANAIVGAATPDHLSSLGTGSPNLLLYSTATASNDPVIGLNPDALTFNVVRVSGAPAALTGVPSDSASIPHFQAQGSGEPKTGTAQVQSENVITTANLTASGWVVLSNTGGESFVWSASSSQPWLSVTPTGGELVQGYGVRLKATADASTLPNGTSNGTIDVVAPKAANSPQPISITANVTEATPLDLGTSLGPLSGSAGELSYFLVSVPEGVFSLAIATDGGSGDVDLYVRYGEVPNVSEYDCRPFLVGSTERCVVSLPPAGTYYVMLRGFSSYSGAALSAGAGGPPFPPSNLSGTAVSISTANLTWTDGSFNETSFELQRQEFVSGQWSPYSAIATPGANTTGYTDTGLSGGRSFRYKIRACNEAGCSSWEKSSKVTTPAVHPAKPGAITGVAVLATQIDVAWDGVDGETNYALQRRQLVDGTWTSYSNVATLDADVLSYSDGGLAGNQSYRYRIRACNDAGCSAYLASQVVTTPQAVPPAVPGNRTGVAISPTQIDLSWGDVDWETHFQLQREGLVNGTWSAWALIDAPDANATGYSDTDLTGAQTYRYRIRACNDSGCSPYRRFPDLTTQTPAAPTDLSGTVISSHQIDLTWPDVDGELNYRLQRRERVDGTWTAYAMIANPGANSVSYSDDGLTGGRDYRYRIAACGDLDCSSFTSGPILTTLDAGPPDAPTNLTSTVASSSRIDLTWDHVTLAIPPVGNFQLQRRGQVEGTWTSYSTFATPDGSVGSYSDLGLSPGTAYRYRIRACNIDGCSAWDVASVVTTPDILLLLDNGTMVTHPGAGAAGADVSMASLDSNIAGSAALLVDPTLDYYRIADDFTVPAAGWAVETVVTYAYESFQASPGWTAFELRVWDGPPNSDGSTIVATTASATFEFAGIYRVFNGASLMNTDRPVQRITWDLGSLNLAAGAYWLDWQVQGGAAAWAPYVMDPNGGDPITVTGNSLQRTSSGWAANLAPYTAETPFLLVGVPGDGVAGRRYVRYEPRPAGAPLTNSRRTALDTRVADVLRSSGG